MTSGLLPLYAGVIGSIVGSFLNVVAHRIPRGQSIVLPASRCPYCRGRIAARDNVPIFSWLLLRRRCRRCRAPISARYPAVEAATAILFAVCAIRFQPLPHALVAAIFCSVLLVLAVIDLEHFLLPDSIALPGIVLGLALQRWIPAVTLLDAVLGVLVGAGLLILTMNFWFWLRGHEGMGLGDVNMLALVGAFLGWQGVVVTLFVAAVTGAVIGLALMATGRVQLQSKLPFGAFLALGGLAALFGGPQILGRYLALL